MIGQRIKKTPVYKSVFKDHDVEENDTNDVDVGNLEFPGTCSFIQ